MKLMTKELLAQFAKVQGEGTVALAKFFNPTGNWTWYASEFDPETGIFFGLVSGFEVEYGSFSLNELQSFRGPFGLGIERDLYFTPRPLREIQRDIIQGVHV